MNHRPTDTAIKNSTRYLHVRTVLRTPSTYRQTDHANKTWADLRLDIELIITNNTTGTSCDPIFRNRERNRWDQAPVENRVSRTLYDAYNDPSSQLNHNGKRHHHDTYHQGPQDVRAATPTPTTTSPTTKNTYPCSNCGADHRATKCSDPKCYISQAILPSAAARQAHYLATHEHDLKRTRFGPTHLRSHHTPLTSPFLSHSTEDMTNPSPNDNPDTHPLREGIPTLTTIRWLDLNLIAADILPSTRLLATSIRILRHVSGCHGV